MRVALVPLLLMLSACQSTSGSDKKQRPDTSSIDPDWVGSGEARLTGLATVVEGRRTELELTHLPFRDCGLFTSLKEPVFMLGFAKHDDVGNYHFMTVQLQRDTLPRPGTILLDAQSVSKGQVFYEIEDTAGSDTEVLGHWATSSLHGVDTRCVLRIHEIVDLPGTEARTLMDRVVQGRAFSLKASLDCPRLAGQDYPRSRGTTMTFRADVRCEGFAEVGN
jgi:hypothetical protein